MGSTSMSEPNRIGDWIRISTLGSGGFGTVTLWRCSKTDDSIAIKKCKLQCSTSLTAKHKERWCNEVQIMKDLDHPNIVKFKPLPTLLEKELNTFNPSKLPLLPMEYCQNGNLRHILTQPLNMCGLEEATVKNVLSDISNAVNYLHSKNITHRDIKPENIVLQDCPTRGITYKLIDLGYAKELNDSTVSFVGTLYYLAPEIYANRNYDRSVDYWSLGVLSFEIICGVLPFLPRLSPIDRYRLMKEKRPDHICVFKNSSGNFQFSSELLQENRISDCLKSHMEIWLQKALNFDPRLRLGPFQNSNNFFQQLNFILKKKILTVFVVYRYQFFSYEFDECTRLSTVRQWIKRDTEIPEEEQLLLGTYQFTSCEEDSLISYCFVENYELFLFKRHALFNIDKHFYPRLVKLLFDRAGDLFSWHDVKAIYSHCIHYIQRDIHLGSSLTKAMDLYLQEVDIILSKVMRNWRESREKLIKLSDKIEEFNRNFEGKHLYCKDEVIYDSFMKFYASIKKCETDEHLLDKNIQKWVKKFKAMRTINIHDDIVKLPQIKECLDKATICLQKTADASEQRKDKLGCGEMLRIMLKVVKLKDALFTNENLRKYTLYLGKAVDYLQTLVLWSESFDSYIDSMHETFDFIIAEGDTLYEKIEREPKKNVAACVVPLTKNALQQAQDLSKRCEEIVHESVNNISTIRDEIESYIQDISSLL